MWYVVLLHEPWYIQNVRNFLCGNTSCRSYLFLFGLYAPIKLQNSSLIQLIVFSFLFFPKVVVLSEPSHLDEKKLNKLSSENYENLMPGFHSDDENALTSSHERSRYIQRSSRDPYVISQSHPWSTANLEHLLSGDGQQDHTKTLDFKERTSDDSPHSTLSMLPWSYEHNQRGHQDASSPKQLGGPYIGLDQSKPNHNSGMGFHHEEHRPVPVFHPLVSLCIYPRWMSLVSIAHSESLYALLIGDCQPLSGCFSRFL